MKNNNNALGSAVSAAVRQYLAAAKDYRVNPIEALDAVGLSTGILDNGISRVEGTEFQRLIHWLVKRCADPLFGLNTAKHVIPGSYSLLGYMVMNCSTLREALSIIPRYETIVGNMGITRVERRGNHIAICWSCNYTDPVVRPHMVDGVLGSWVKFSRWLVQDTNIRPAQVMLERHLPAERYRRAYENFFGCEVKFDCQENSVVIPDYMLDLKFSQPDPELLASLEQQATAMTRELQDAGTLVLQTRSLLLNMMQHSVPRREKIASQLGIAERTLQRRLDDAGTSYQQLLDELRHEMAIDWLTSSSSSIADISERLGFSETRSFHRRFKSWSGISPGEYRKRHLREQRANRQDRTTAAKTESFQSTSMNSIEQGSTTEAYC